MKKKSSFLQSMVAVMWAFLGVRKKAGLQKDVASLSFFHIILAGIVGALIFMSTLLLIVKFVLSH
jgi:ABC-type antimicrobial peptide transport system permease subunit